MMLSENFALSEFTTSQTAARLRIGNVPGAAEIAAMALLCEKVLEPVRAHFDRPVVLSSGYRSPALNEAVHGSDSSQHIKGEAADIEVPGISNVALAEWIRDRLAFDQLILEFYTRGQPTSGWVHVSYREPCRGQVLTAAREYHRVTGKLMTVYMNGLRA